MNRGCWRHDDDKFPFTKELLHQLLDGHIYVNVQTVNRRQTPRTDLQGLPPLNIYLL